MSKAKPILFTGPMVRAIFDGPKTQTRRVIKPQPPADANEVFYWWRGDGCPRDGFAASGCYYRTPRGLQVIPNHIEPGDVLWVRETFSPCACDACRAAYPKQPRKSDIVDAPHPVLYQATYPGPSGVVWRPSRFMPRWACRLWLEVTKVREQRLQDITKQDAVAEGFEREPSLPIDPRDWFRNLWDSINAKRGYAWESNPWVFAYTFKQVPMPSGWPEASQ